MGNSFRTSRIVDSPVETRLKFQTPTIVTGKQGIAPGELYYPNGVAIDGATNQIFVANQFNDRVEIFSEAGEYLCQLGVGQLILPYGIAIYGDSIYISCWDNAFDKFSLTNMSFVRRIGGRGSSYGDFHSPRQLTTDPVGRVLITDQYYNRISIHDPDLNHIRNITLQSMSSPFYVKVSRNRLYVLCPDNNPCMLVLTLEGDKLHSLITRGEGMNALYPVFFCFDPLNNFVISDSETNIVRVFSPEGNLLHTVGRKGHQPGGLYRPTEVAITPNGRSVCVSWNENYCLQIFPSLFVCSSVLS